METNYTETNLEDNNYVSTASSRVFPKIVQIHDDNELFLRNGWPTKGDI